MDTDNREDRIPYIDIFDGHCFLISDSKLKNLLETNSCIKKKKKIWDIPVYIFTKKQSRQPEQQRIIFKEGLNKWKEVKN